MFIRVEIERARMSNQLLCMGSPKDPRDKQIIYRGHFSLWPTVSSLFRPSRICKDFIFYPRSCPSRLVSDHCCFCLVHTQSVPNGMKYASAEFDGPATVQLATPETSLVVHMARSNGKRSLACVPVLQSVLCDESIVKVGCQIDQDMIDLMTLWGVSQEPRSRFDLGRLRSPGTPTPGLKKLSRDILGIKLPKPKITARSNWAHVPLKECQVMYSARDAWVAAAIAEVLAERDPRFEAAVLANDLRSQQSLVEAKQRTRRRRRAKNRLSIVLSKYKSRLHMRKNVSPEEQRAVERLDRIIVEKILEKEAVFGFSWDLDAASLDGSSLI